jgi:antitoxin component YwqK of YwqJK toxin-antitoxin module
MIIKHKDNRIYFDDNNTRLQEHYFNINGNIEGIQKYYYKNGKIKAISHYVNKLIIKLVEYYIDGKIKNKYIYNNGKLIKLFSLTTENDKYMRYRKYLYNDKGYMYGSIDYYNGYILNTNSYYY